MRGQVASKSHWCIPCWADVKVTIDQERLRRLTQ